MRKAVPLTPTRLVSPSSQAHMAKNPGIAVAESGGSTQPQAQQPLRDMTTVLFTLSGRVPARLHPFRSQLHELSAVHFLGGGARMGALGQTKTHNHTDRSCHPSTAGSEGDCNERSRNSPISHLAFLVISPGTDSGCCEACSNRRRPSVPFVALLPGLYNTGGFKGPCCFNTKSASLTRS